MARKGENVYKRLDGRWEARYAKGRQPSGRILYGYCYGKTYREAKAKAAQAQSAQTPDEPATAGMSRRRLSFYCQEWLEIQKSRVRNSTYEKYESSLRLHILPQLGACRPRAVDTRRIEQFKREALDEGLSPKTVKDVLMELHSILKYAASQYPGLFPAADIRCPREEEKEIRVLSPEEQLRLATYLRLGMDPCKFGVLLALQTGLRIGELCALRWGNISLSDRTIRVDASMRRQKNYDAGESGRTKVVIGAPKSRNSARTIPMSGSTAALCAEQPPCPPTAFVLTGTEQFMEPRTLQRRFEKYTHDCGLEGVHFHTLRHTFATRCVEVGFEIKSLSEVLGHANTSVTLNRYVHSSLDLKRSNMDKLTAAGL